MNKVKKSKKWIWLIVIAVVVIAVIVIPGVLQRNALMKAQIESLKTVEVKLGGITKSVSGSGSLQSADTTDITAVSGVKIDKVLVEAGDIVKSGDKLLTLDPAVLAEMAADMDVSLKQLDMELRRLSGKEAADYVTAPVEGRIKKIYAAEDDYVSDVAKENGALMVLSTDGNMKVEFAPKGQAEAGMEVTVSDGKHSYEAQVVSYAKDGCTALLSDDGPAVGQDVSVSAKDGTLLGEGKLAVNQPLNIIAAGGRIEKIYVDENQKVSRNKKLIRINENPLSSDYGKKLSEREKQSKDYTQILKLMEDPFIRADADGIVKEIAVSDGEYVKSATENDTDALVMKINQKDLILHANVDQLDMPFVKPGQKASVTFDALPGKEFSAKVQSLSSISAQVDGVTKYDVTLAFDPVEGLLEGMDAMATIVVEEKNDILVIPFEALQEEDEINFVYTQSGEKGELGQPIEVKTGLSDGTLVEITEGLKAGEKISYRFKGAAENGGMFQGMGGMRQQVNGMQQGSEGAEK